MENSKPKNGGRLVFTNIDRSKCSRTVPMEVLVLGLSKTGTSSMKEALIELGYSDVYHMTSILAQNPRDTEMWVRAFDAFYGGKGKFGREEWDQLLGHCMAVTDAPCIDFSYELVEAYPDAKVILLTRNIDSWFESYMDTVGGIFAAYHRRFRNPWRVEYYIMPRWAVGDLFDVSFKYVGQEWAPVRGKKMFLDHNARVRELVPKEKLLEFDVRQGWEPLCGFLGKPVPKDKPFPHAMERLKFKEIEKNLRKQQIMLMTLQTAKIIGAVGVAGLASWLGWRQFRV